MDHIWIVTGTDVSCGCELTDVYGVYSTESAAMHRRDTLRENIRQEYAGAEDWMIEHAVNEAGFEAKAFLVDTDIFAQRAYGDGCT